LTILTALDGGSSHVGRNVTVEPLLAEHRQEGGEEGSCETGEEDNLNLDYRGRRSGPLWKGGGVVSEGRVVDLVDEDAEKGRSFVIRVGSQLRIDLNDEGRRHS
jgi:hypothetical protein